MTVNIFRPFLTTLCIQSVLSQTLHMDNKNNSGSRLNHQFLMLLTHMRKTINQNYSFMSCLTSISTCCVAIFISLAICSCIYHDKLPSPRAKNQTKWPIVTFTGQSTIVKLDIYFSLDVVLTAYAKNKRMRARRCYVRRRHYNQCITYTLF